MHKIKLGLIAFLLAFSAKGFAEATITLYITNTGWVTPLYTEAVATNITALIDRSFLFTEIPPQATKDFSIIVGRLSPPPPEKLEIHFFDDPDRHGEPAAKWGYSDFQNPLTGRWEANLCDFDINRYVDCSYTGNLRQGYFVYIKVDGDSVRLNPLRNYSAP